MIYEFMLNHKFYFRFLYAIVGEVHDSISNKDSFKIEIIFHRSFIISEYPDCNVRHILPRITFTW